MVDKSGVTSGETFNPGTGAWRIATRIKPYLIRIAGRPGKHLPAPSSCSGCGAADPSYNLIQKGRNGTSVPGGFYKVEIMGYDGAIGGINYVKGSVHCQFRDSDGTSIDAFSAAVGSGHPRKIDSQDYYRIDCYRAGSSVILPVTQEGVANATQIASGVRTIDGTSTSLGMISPENSTGATAFSPLFSIGKKPQSTHIEDSFAGWVDYVILATS